MKKNKTASKKRKRREQKIEEEKLEEKISEEETKNAIKEIAKEEIIEREGIRNFLVPEEAKAPVLERIANQEPQIIESQFETEQQETTREGRIDYVTENEPIYSSGREMEQEERKYETTFIPPVLTRRETFEGGGEFLRPTENAWGETRQINESPQQFEAFETRRRLPFEEEQKKYKKVKF